MELFESYDRRIDKILGVLKEYGIGSVEECRDICAAAGLDPYKSSKTYSLSHLKMPAGHTPLAPLSPSRPMHARL